MTDPLASMRTTQNWLALRFYRSRQTGWTRIGPVGWCGRTITVGFGPWGRTWTRGRSGDVMAEWGIDDEGRWVLLVIR